MVILSSVWCPGYSLAGLEMNGVRLSAAQAVGILKRTINATRLIYLLYQLLLLVTSPLVALYLLYRGLKDKRYFTSLPERLGFLPQSIQTTGRRTIWLHAVSVGEVLSAVTLIRELREKAGKAGIRVIHLTPPVFDPIPLAGHTLPAGKDEYRSPFEG